MASFLNPQMGVAMSGVKWDTHGFKLWQSTDPNVILFTPTQPSLAIGPGGRYEVAVSQYRQQREGTYKITGGAAAFTITSALQYDPAQTEALMAEWRRVIREKGGSQTDNPRFVPLNTQRGEAVVLMNPMSGKPHPEHNNKDIGTPGGTSSFLIELTDLGAQEWAEGIKNRTAIPCDVKLSYEYLRMLPEVKVKMVLNGKKVFDHFSAAADVSVNAFWYGGSVKIDAMFEEMQRQSAVEIIFSGNFPPELEKLRQELISTFLKQAQEQWFKLLFEPAPQVEAAKAGNTSGVFGGANFAFKWKKSTDAVDNTFDITVTGPTWLKASMDITVGALFSPLDASYVTEVNQELSFPSTVVVDGDPEVQQVAVSWSPSEGHGPEAPVFESKGGIQSYVVTAKEPDKVKIKYTAKVNYASPSWPIIEKTEELVGQTTAVIKPSSWVGRNYIYMFVREGGAIKMTDIENDYLVCNVSYSGPHLRAPIKASARITPDMPLEFAYPLSPMGEKGVAKFSAFGVIGGKLVRSKEQEINADEEAVFIVASKEGIQLVSKDAVLPEDDAFAQALLGSRGRPVITSGKRPETTRPAAKTKEIEGSVVAAEFGVDGPALWLRTDQGEDVRVGLHDAREGKRFGLSPIHAKITLDDSNTASRIEVRVS